MLGTLQPGEACSGESQNTAYMESETCDKQQETDKMKKEEDKMKKIEDEMIGEEPNGKTKEGGDMGVEQKSMEKVKVGHRRKEGEREETCESAEAGSSQRKVIKTDGMKREEDELKKNEVEEKPNEGTKEGGDMVVGQESMEGVEIEEGREEGEREDTRASAEAGSSQRKVIKHPMKAFPKTLEGFGYTFKGVCAYK